MIDLSVPQESRVGGVRFLGNRGGVGARLATPSSYSAPLRWPGSNSSTKTEAAQACVYKSASDRKN